MLPVLLGVGTGVLATPPALLLAIMSGGGGHGHYTWMRALFPVPVLATFNHSIGAVAIGLAIVQLPLYGALIGWSWSRRRWWPVAAVAFVHFVAAAACFGGAAPNFS